MTDVLSELWQKHKLLTIFKTEMNKRGYAGRDLFVLQIQIDLLNKIIEMESMNILNELLKKTYFRLLKSIDKGVEYLPDILLNPEQYVLNTIDKDKEAWIDNNTLIFTTRNDTAAFSKVSRKSDGYSYVDNKWQ
jgi:hypothetical protein